MLGTEMLNEKTTEEDEEDEDYVPEVEEDEEDAPSNLSAVENAVDPINRPLSEAKRKAVDEAFDDLFGNSSSSIRADSKKQKMEDVIQRKMLKKKTSKKLRKNQKVLASIFGRKAANKMVESNSANDMAITKGSIDEITNDRLNELVNSVKDKEQVTVTKRFAGQDVTIQVDAATATSSAKSKQTTSSRVAKSGGGIDKVLSDLSGPQKISTVVKTSSDWDQFKQTHGLEEELDQKAQGKDAYLVKKDFLNRVDLRQFEQEKADRDLKRVAREAK